MLIYKILLSNGPVTYKYSGRKSISFFICIIYKYYSYTN